MKVRISHGVTIPLKNNHRCDITVFEGMLSNTVHYDVWDNEKMKALYLGDKIFFRWEMLLGKRISKILTKKKANEMYDEINRKLGQLGIDDCIYEKN